MAPSNPKRPPPPSAPSDGGPDRRKPTTEVDLPFDASQIEDPPEARDEDLPFETRDLDLPFESAGVDLPFDTDEVTPLDVDNPAPQRVAQYPAGRRLKKSDQIPTEVMTVPGELAQRFSTGTEETFRAVFVYVERGPGAGQLVPVGQGKLVIGRSSRSDLRLQHPSISRRHAELTRTQERFFLKDLSSQNGTYVNKARLLAEREVFPGDTLAVGTAVLKLRGPMSEASHLPSRATDRPRGLRLALFASAVGFGLAGFLLYALLTSNHASAPVAAAPPNAPVPIDNLVREGPIVPVPELRHAEQHEPQNHPPPQVAQAAPAPPPAQRTPAPARPVHKAPASKRRQIAQRAAPAPTPEAVPASDPGDTPANAEALEAYRRGELPEALRQASGPLLTTLTRFQVAYGSGRRALAAHDPAAASRHLTRALELDRAIAHGEGTFNRLLRKELAELETLEPQPSSRSAIDDAFGE